MQHEMHHYDTITNDNNAMGGELNGLYLFHSTNSDSN